jgi:hypothetical protein
MVFPRLVDYIENATRRHSTLGMLSPADYEQTTINDNPEKHQDN